MFGNIDKLILKCIWHIKGTRITEKILTKKNKVGEITLFDFKTYSLVIIIKTVCFDGGRDTYINRTEKIPEIYAHKYG